MINREFKFRFWNRREGKYYFPETSLSVFWNDNLKKSGVYLEHDYECYDFDIEQYTGLKDKNGKEIYEGDWISSRFYPSTPNLFSECEVFYNSEVASFCLRVNSESKFFTPIMGKDIEVIGNIHEGISKKDV